VFQCLPRQLPPGQMICFPMLDRGGPVGMGGIFELGEQPVRPKLAISLNASTEEQRRDLQTLELFRRRRPAGTRGHDASRRRGQSPLLVRSSSYRSKAMCRISCSRSACFSSSVVMRHVPSRALLCQK
jgi:hypothetical protein